MGGSSGCLRKARVLVFDDDASIRNVLARFFGMRGYEVLTFNDPASVCPACGKGGDFCMDGNACSDIMITDVYMPGVNGIELLEHQAQKGCKLNFRNKAAISGSLDEQSRERVRNLGCSCFGKPFTINALSEWLAGCEQRLDLNQPLSTRRREARFDNYREITFSFPSAGDIYSGVSFNVSPSGLCLKIPAPLTQAQTVRVQGSHFPSSRQASVRWVSQVDNGAFLAGLHCASDVQLPRGVLSCVCAGI